MRLGEIDGIPRDDTDDRAASDLKTFERTKPQSGRAVRERDSL